MFDFLDGHLIKLVLKCSRSIRERFKMDSKNGLPDVFYPLVIVQIYYGSSEKALARNAISVYQQRYQQCPDKVLVSTSL